MHDFSCKSRRHYSEVGYGSERSSLHATAICLSQSNEMSIGNNPFSGVAGTLRKDGNISQAIWRVRGRARQAYSYMYDGLQRISSANYSDIADAGTVSASGTYNTSYTYADLRGNISNNVRNGLYLSGACYTPAILDNMTYTYTSGTNKISSISDAALSTQGGFRTSSGTYTYDVNGNQISNAAKGITSISYNHLNLPTNFTLSGSRTIDFTYAADGTKLRKVVKTGATINLVQEYVNGIEYRGTAIPATTIEGIYHAEGRLYNNVGTWQREYVIKDHLGDTRIAYADINGDGVIATPSEILQENNYDAFGYGLDGVYMNHSNPDNLYQYNGKELNNDHGIGLLSYGARFYDAGIARWTSVDKLSEKYSHISPYSYVANNPISAIDPDGLRIYFVAGVGNDQRGWNYTQKWKDAFEDSGLKGFTPLNATHGSAGDMSFSVLNRSSAYENVPNGEVSSMYNPTSLPSSQFRTQFVQDDQIDNASNQIVKDLAANPLGAGEQVNLAGYSYGSILQAHVALRLANSGQKIDNLILVGSPISSNSALYKDLINNKNIGKVLRVDIKGDYLSNPKDMLRFMIGIGQNRDLKNTGVGPHFNLARPGDGDGKNNSTYRSLREVVIQYLQNQGVK